MPNDMNLPSDNTARELALDISQSHHVEAPAGSGKTMLLVARYLKLLSLVKHPHEILALTFTNKAAGEMKTRIGSLFQKADSGLEPANSLEATLLESAKKALKQHQAHRFLLLSPEGLQVMTFHGFCLNLVKRAPLEAGVPPESVVLEEEEQGLVLDEAIKELIHDVLSMPAGAPERSAFENRLLRLNNRLPGLIEEIKGLVKKRDLFSDLVKALRMHPDLDDFSTALTKRMGGVVEVFLSKIPHTFRATSLGQDWNLFWRDLKENNAPNADLLPQDIPQSAWTDLAAWKQIAEVLTTKNGKPRQRMGPAMGGFYKGFSRSIWVEHVKNLPLVVCRLLCDLRDLPGPNDKPTDIDALADLIIIVARAITTYDSRCRQQHVLDFVGLEQAALKALEDDDASDIQLFLDHRIQHILVDEFQDTSRSQWTLIQRLCAGWTPDDGRTIFLVGDPKQSIYAFRKAEVRLFLEAKNGIPISGQGVLPITNIQLKANFRSETPLVSWTNDLFGRTAMANPDAAFDEVAFQPSTAHPEPQSSENSAAVSLNIFLKDNPDSTPTEAEAAWLAETVRYVAAEGSVGASIGILLFTRTRLSFYLKALRKIGLAVRVKEGLKVAEQPEVVHLYQMMTALCRPHDDLAWASLARSPWAWVDSSLLLQIASISSAGWPQKFKLAAEKFPDIKRLHHAFSLGRKRVGRDTLARVVRDVWMALDGPERVAARFGAEGVANCRLFLEVLESIDTGIAEETLVRLDTALETLYAPESPDAASAPVDLMTVHAAKGLEFDIVFLPFLDWQPLRFGQHPPYLLERSPKPPGLPLIAMGADRRLGDPEPGFRLLKRLANGREIGEARRRLYVGITRARKKLFLSGIASNTSDGPKAPNNSPLDWILAHTSNDKGDLINIFFNPKGQTVTRQQIKKIRLLPDPVSFEAQPLPYLIETPSGLADSSEYAQGEAKAETEQGVHAAIRGTITHRLIESLWRDDKLPEADRIAIALVAEGMNPEAADIVSQDIAQELKACQNEPFFKWLLDRKHPYGESEYALEGVKTQGTIQTGILDFVKQDGKDWWIVDFKTSRPGQGEAKGEFVINQAEYYRPQLTAYKGMLSKAKGVDPAYIKAGIYLTSLQQWHEITPDK